MFRRSAVLVVALLSMAAVGTAVAQDSAAAAKPAKPAHKMHMAAAKQDTAHKAVAAAKPTWTKEQIKTAQAGLIKAGLYKGDTNGVMNAATRKALREYQKQNKLPATGRLSDDVLKKLGGS